MDNVKQLNEQEIMAKLAEPFPPEEIEWRVGATNGEKTKGIALAYVTNRAIQNRLDEVFGCFGWKNEFREWKGKAQICGISVFANGEWITKWDGADDSNMEATKGGLSDAMKRAAYQWGIGRYLYKLENVWCPIKQAGKSYVLTEVPQLPVWALPKGYKYPEQPDRSQQTQPQKPEQKQGEPNKCSCGVTVTQAVQAYSMQHFGRVLCQPCQKKAKEAKASA